LRKNFEERARERFSAAVRERGMMPAWVEGGGTEVNGSLIWRTLQILCNDDDGERQPAREGNRAHNRSFAWNESLCAKSQQVRADWI